MRNFKVQRLMNGEGADGLRAFAVYLDSVCWSAENLTDGRLPNWYRPSVAWTPKLSELLVDTGLWIEVATVFAETGLPESDGPPLRGIRWLINDYHSYGITYSEWTKHIQQRRDAAAKRWARPQGASKVRRIK